jgi:predicted nucleotidyltransferase
MPTLHEINRILKAHKQELREKYKVKEIGIFGSFVRGEEKKRGDVDILVEFEEVPDLLTFIEIEIYLEKLLKKKVDLVRKGAIRPELKKRILSEVMAV